MLARNFTSCHKKSLSNLMIENYRDWHFNPNTRKRTDVELAKAFGISKQNFNKWRKMPNFPDKIDSIQTRSPHQVAHWILCNSTNLKIKSNILKKCLRFSTMFPFPIPDNVNNTVNVNDDSLEVWIKSLNAVQLNEEKARQELRVKLAQEKKLKIENDKKLKQLIPIQDVTDSITHCLSTLTQGMQKMCIELPPSLVGKEQSEMITILQDGIKKHLDEIAEQIMNN